METKVKAGVQTKVAGTAQTDKKAPQFVAGNPVNKVSEKEESKDQAQTGKAGFVDVNKLAEQVIPAVAPEQKSEPSKMEIKATIAERMAEQKAILERHIRLGDELARKIRHRDNLTAIITTLDKFELNLKNESEETESNYYQGCVLTIKDDNGETFTTKNPTIIKGVAEQVGSLCSDKLKEVETDIVNLIPA
jgi:hypothetical protein